ncbi:MAG TPA: MarR family transcriptional regulator [Acidimicrobiales bacterium]|nr:MarR family transcriptional regulator [Acidimicrobiales bacterium]
MTDAVLIASRAMVALAARTIPDDVTLAQFRALVVVREHDGITPGELAERMGVNASTATRAVQRLETKRYLRRRPGSDRRMVCLHLTAGGRRLVDSALERRRAQLDVIVRRIPRAERQHLVSALAAFSRAAGEEPVPAWAEGWKA